MDDESGDDDKDELRSGWGGELRREWWGWRNECGSWFKRRGDVAICDFQGDGWRARKSDNRWGAGTARRLKRDKVVKIARLSSCKNFVSEREKFIFDAFVEWRDLRMGVIWVDLGALTTARAREFWICCSWLTGQFGRLRIWKVGLCESRTARRPTRYFVVVRCSSLRACWSISVKHSESLPVHLKNRNLTLTTFMRHLKFYHWGLLGKWVKYNKNYFYLFIHFFLWSAYRSDLWMDFYTR